MRGPDRASVLSILDRDATYPTFQVVGVRGTFCWLAHTCPCLFRGAATSAVSCLAIRMKGELHPTKNRL